MTASSPARGGTPPHLPGQPRPNGHPRQCIVGPANHGGQTAKPGQTLPDGPASWPGTGVNPGRNPSSAPGLYPERQLSPFSGNLTRFPGVPGIPLGCSGSQSSQAAQDRSPHRRSRCLIALPEPPFEGNSPGCAVQYQPDIISRTNERRSNSKWEETQSAETQ